MTTIGIGYMFWQVKVAVVFFEPLPVILKHIRFVGEEPPR